MPVWTCAEHNSGYDVTSSHVTSCEVTYCGLKVQKPTQALQSVKDLGSTFDLSPKWERSMLFFDIFLWVISRVPQIQISK
jgi:hypothetical protein